MSGASSLVVTPTVTPDASKPADATVQIVDDPSGRQQVRVTANADSTAPPAKPVVEAKKEDQKAAEKPADEKPARPEWLPTKFETPDALKASTLELLTKQGAPKAILSLVERSESGAEVAEIYADAEKKLGTKEEKKEQTPEEKAAAEKAAADAAKASVRTPEIRAAEVVKYGEGIAAILDKAGLVGEEIGKRYEAAGFKIAETDYKAMEKAGVSREMFEGWMIGAYGRVDAATQLAESHIVEIKETAGSIKEYDVISKWAADGNWTKEDLDTYNVMVSSGNKSVCIRAVKDLKAAYVKANGKAPVLIDGGGATSQGDSYQSWDEVRTDMATKAYKTGDPAFHAKVDAKLKRSSLS